MTTTVERPAVKEDFFRRAESNAQKRTSVEELRRKDLPAFVHVSIDRVTGLVTLDA